MEKYFDINTRGCSVRCKLYCNNPRDLRQVIVFCHGFGGHKDTRAAARFAEKTLSKFKSSGVLCFDWPCHGSDARGKLVLDDCSLYLDIVVNHIKDAFATDEIYCYATSFGAYCVLRHLQLNGNPFRKICVRCPALRLYELIYNKIMTDENKILISKGREALIGFDRKVKVPPQFLEEIKSCDIMQFDFMEFSDDILIIHGTKDEIAPFEDSVSFADNNVIELLPVEGADHRFTDPKKLDLANLRALEFFGIK